MLASAKTKTVERGNGKRERERGGGAWEEGGRVIEERSMGGQELIKSRDNKSRIESSSLCLANLGLIQAKPIPT